MSLLPRRPIILAAAFAVVATLGIGAGALTMTAKPPTPPIIATVDLQVAYAGLEKRKQKEQELQDKAKEFQTNLEKLKKEIEDDNKQYDIMTAGPQKKQLGQQLVRKSIQLDFDAKYAEKFLDQMKGELMHDLYDDIASACKELAVRNGYTMVTSDDSKAAIIGTGFGEVMRSISLKRTLYVDPAHDVTKELIDLMNNQFAASAGKN